ncbi:MAG TPA: hypothetical protein VGF84_01395 [Micromonosporaceae bacterium]|jgi:hypothetical protein
MNLAFPLGPDELLTAGMGVIGTPVVIIFLVKLAFAVKAWLEAGRSARANIRRGIDLAGRGAAQARALPGARILGGMFITTVTLAAQLLLLAMCYVAGNCISIGVHLDQERYSAIGQLILRDHLRTLEPSVLAGVLRYDPISSTYLWVGIICIGASWVWALRRKSTGWTGTVLAAPAIVLTVGGAFVLAFAGLAFLFELFIALLSGDWSFNLGSVAIPWLITVAASGLYWLACISGTGAPATVVDTWLPRGQVPRAA